ncbi:HAD family phosphatase [soil metagenome]
MWDCDGVLVDTERLVTRLEAQWITALGWPLTQADVVERFMGRSEATMTAEIERALGHELPAGWYADLRGASHELFRAELTAVDGVVDVLDALEVAGVATCVASSSGHDRLALVLSITGLAARFDGRVHSAEDVDRGKPHPDLFLHAARVQGVAPTDCVVIEDSEPGVRGGVAAGMRVLGFGGGLAPTGSLRSAGAEIFEEMAELPALLGLVSSGPAERQADQHAGQHRVRR